MPSIYHTANMEQAIHRMFERNQYSLIYENYNCPRKIKLRFGSAAALPIYQKIEHFPESHCILKLKFKPHYVSSPFCNAMFFPECPLSIKTFESFYPHAEREMIVYKPPNWELHEEAMNFKYPNSHFYLALLKVIKSGLGALHDDRARGAVAYSGWPKKETVAFDAKSIKKYTGIPEPQMRKMLGKICKGWFRKVTCYQPVMRPSDREPELQHMYDALVANPDWTGQGWRYGVTGVEDLIAAKFVKPMRAIYLLWPDRERIDFDLIDAISNAKRADWYRMKNLIDSSPDYLEG